MMNLIPLAFTPGGGELLLVFIILLILFGSKKLPGIARSLGRTMEEFRRAAREVTSELTRADLDTAPPPEPEHYDHAGYDDHSDYHDEHGHVEESGTAAEGESAIGDAAASVMEELDTHTADETGAKYTEPRPPPSSRPEADAEAAASEDAGADVPEKTGNDKDATT